MLLEEVFSRLFPRPYWTYSRGRSLRKGFVVTLKSLLKPLRNAVSFSPTCCNSHLKHFILALVILRSSYMLTCLPFSMLVPYLLHLHACASISVPLLPTLPCLTLPFLILHYALLPYPTLRCLQRLYPTPLVLHPFLI